MTPDYQAWLRAGLEAGRSLEVMALEKGGGKVTRHSIAEDLIEMLARGGSGIDPSQIVPHVFNGQWQPCLHIIILSLPDWPPA